MANSRGTMNRVGRRMDSTAPRRSTYHVSQPGRRVEGQRRGKREKPSAGREQWHVLQLIISAMLLVAVIGVKLAAPDTMDRYRDKLLGLMSQNTDFTEAFSAVGKAMGDGGFTDALGEAYQEVFGPDEEKAEKTDQEAEDAPEKSGEEGQATSEQVKEPQTERTEKQSKSEEKAEEKSEEKAEAVIYTGENLPKDVCMTQRVLGFAYADPLEGTLTSGFGYREHPMDGSEKFHYGLDIDAEKGTVISSFAAGLVTAVGESSELGKYVMVAHDGGYTTLYAHCSRITASSGQTVKLGDPIAEVGETGRATGPHLHFELHQNTIYLNPIYYVTF